MARESSDRSEARPERRLNSWKEIAGYLNCGVRTAQRWERTEGLPVRRHLHQTLASVYALTSEIDRWREQRSRRLLVPARHIDAADDRRGLVGRIAERSRLDEHWRRARDGYRQVVFVTGEIGIGKTALVESFLDSVNGDAVMIVGQCVEQYGAGEAYLPILDGLARLVRQPDGRAVAATLSRHASAWLTQIRDGVSRGEHPSHPPERAPTRTVRQLVDALEIASRDSPLIIFLDDLHWSDWSTAEFVERLARRADPARILVIGTYRPDELIYKDHPLLRIQHELHVHRLCHHIDMPRFAEAEVASFLETYGIWPDLPGVARQLHHWTGGNPLFLGVVVDQLINGGRIAVQGSTYQLEGNLDPTATSVPPTLHDIVKDRVRRLTSTERRLLEAASVAGPVFTAALLAAAVDWEVGECARVRESLADRQQLIRRQSHDPLSPIVGSAYAFLHSLYETVLYESLSPSTRARLHGAIGDWLERASSAYPDAIAAELAMHFERAGDFARAVTHYQRGAVTALNRSADHEAYRCAVRALDHLQHLPPGADRDRLELGIRITICAAVSGGSTMNDRRVQNAYAEALHMSERVADDASLVPALLGIQRFEFTRGNVETGRQVSDRALAIARTTSDSNLLAQVLQHLATVECAAGLIEDAHRHAGEAIDALGHAPPSADVLATSGFGPVVAAMTVRSWTAWYLGYPEEALRVAHAAIARAGQLQHPQTLAFARAWLAVTLELCGEPDSAAWAESAIDSGRRFELPMVTFFAEAALGWIQGRRGDAGGAELIRRSLAFQSGAGIEVWRPLSNSWLAEILIVAGAADEALAAADAGLEVVGRCGIRQFAVELHGVRALALWLAARNGAGVASAPIIAAAEAALDESRRVAREQRARSLELRAALRRVRIATTRSADTAAHAELARIYAAFSEGFNTPDLREARSLLDRESAKRDENQPTPGTDLVNK